jgi:uncharacterized surface protein with fasciclin (FAS1) repeats
MKNIIELAQSTGVHNILVKAIQKAGLVDILNGEGPFTVFAPTDTAFRKAEITLDKIDTLDSDTLKKTLLYHVYSGKLLSKDIKNGLVIEMVSGENAVFSKSYDTYGTYVCKLQNAKITGDDNKASNGVIHVIDKILSPSTQKNLIELAQSTGVHNILVEAIKKAGLVDILNGEGPFTVFAPTDTAFKNAAITLDNLDTFDRDTLKKTLLYHVYVGKVISTDIMDGSVIEMASGENAVFSKSYYTIKLQNAKITGPDNEASNGVIHVIDKILSATAKKNLTQQTHPFIPIGMAVAAVAFLRKRR